MQEISFSCPGFLEKSTRSINPRFPLQIPSSQKLRFVWFCVNMIGAFFFTDIDLGIYMGQKEQDGIFFL